MPEPSSQMQSLMRQTSTFQIAFRERERVIKHQHEDVKTIMFMETTTKMMKMTANKMKALDRNWYGFNVKRKNSDK